MRGVKIKMVRQTKKSEKESLVRSRENRVGRPRGTGDSSDDAKVFENLSRWGASDLEARRLDTA